MNGQAPAILFGVIIYASFVLPGFFRSSPFALEEQIILKSLLARLPILAVLLWATLHHHPLERRRRGWKRPAWRDGAAALGLTALSLLLGYFFSTDADGTGAVAAGPLLIAAVVLFALVTAGVEELFFRSWMLSEFSQNAGWAILISSLSFGIAHLWQGWKAFVFALIMGLVYSEVFRRRRSLMPLVAAHALHNILVQLPQLIQ